MITIKQILIVALTLVSLNCYGTSLSTSDQTAVTLINSVKTLPLEQRIVQLSAALLGKLYQLEPLGEGSTGEFNQQPLYRFDRFDCETYVNTVLALSLAKNLTDFQNKVRTITYLHGQVAFINRSHFPDADLIPNNIKNGFLKEITTEVAGNKDTATARVFINRKNWLQKLTLDRIKIPNLEPRQQTAKLKALHAQANQVSNTPSAIRYIPTNKLFNIPPRHLFSWWHHRDQTQVNWSLLKKIPNGAIFFIVEHNPVLKNKIGTDVNVSHMGFVIWKNGLPYLRAASSLKGQTIDLPLIDYLRAYSDERTMKGIALFQIVNA